MRDGISMWRKCFFSGYFKVSSFAAWKFRVVNIRDGRNRKVRHRLFKNCMKKRKIKLACAQSLVLHFWCLGLESKH